MDIVLLPGLWLDGSVWTEVVAQLRTLGHRGVPVTLPGQGDGAEAATLDEQIDAALAVVDSCATPPLVVGHSAAASLAWIVADRRADGRVAGAAFVGGFPQPDGEQYAAFFDIEDGVMPFPGWAPFDGADSADLDADTRAMMSRTAVPVPEGVATGLVRLTDEARHDVPVTLVCPEFSPDEAADWIDAGELPELASATRLRLVDIDSGHWPMITRPAELARVLADITADVSDEDAPDEDAPGRAEA